MEKLNVQVLRLDDLPGLKPKDALNIIHFKNPTQLTPADFYRQSLKRSLKTVKKYERTDKDMITAAQIRAARALLNVQQDEVEGATGLSKRYLSEIENERSQGKSDALNKLELFYKTRGIDFIEHNGVRETPSGMRILRGQSGFREFYDDIYQEARRSKIEITLLNGSSDLLINALGQDFLKMHMERMIAIKENFRFRVILKEGDKSFLGRDYCEYRWFPSSLFKDKYILTYGRKCAIVDRTEDFEILLFDQPEMAESLRVGFDIAWENVARDPDV